MAFILHVLKILSALALALAVIGVLLYSGLGWLVAGIVTFVYFCNVRHSKQ